MENTAELQGWVERLPADGPAARDELIAHACGRLERLTRRMLRAKFPRVRRWEETGDVFQGAMLRLRAALGAVSPPTAHDFLKLATACIRRELLDLVRHYYGPEGMGANHASAAGSVESSVSDPGGQTHDPARLAEWTDFHRQVEALPEDEREVFQLSWYHGLRQEEIAGVVGCSVPTVKRRQARALRLLRQALAGGMPGAEPRPSGSEGESSAP